jgi:hypothetical protein
VADWQRVRELAATYPGVEESTAYGAPAFKVGGKHFVWMSPSREATGALALRVDPEEKPLLLEVNPDAYFETPHYEGHPILLVHLERIDDAALAERIQDAWLLRAPKRLVAEFERDGSRGQASA